MTPTVPPEHEMPALAGVPDGDECLIFDPENENKWINSDTYFDYTEHRQ